MSDFDIYRTVREILTSAGFQFSLNENCFFVENIAKIDVIHVSYYPAYRLILSKLIPGSSVYSCENFATIVWTQKDVSFLLHWITHHLKF